MKPNYPFAAVAGQSQFKLALLLAAVNPAVGGVLASGPRGCAKSTLAKGLADVLPQAGQSAHPFITLPLGASEDMLVGTLNLQRVMDDQQVAFQPGLLARAHGGVLYVDEVNLLPDNLVDQLLDVAASGVNVVERDGISHQHPAEFILLGTMNPDEGELRPQLKDRFGLSVALHNQFSIEERMDVVRLREAYEQNAEAFAAAHAEQQRALSEQIAQGRERLTAVQISDELRRLIAERCHAAQVDGLRADIVWAQAARAHAALMGRTEAQAADVLAVEELVLQHRRQHSAPPPPPPSFSRPQPPSNSPSNSHSNPPSNPASNPSSDAGSGAGSGSDSGNWGAMPPQKQHTDAVRSAMIEPNGAPVNAPPLRAASSVPDAANRQAGGTKGLAVQAAPSQRVDWFSTLLKNAGRWPLSQLRFQRQRTGTAKLHIIALDTSGSVLKDRAFAKAKGWVLQLAEQAYLKREQILIVGFGNQQVQTLMGRQRAPKAIRRWLDELEAGGGTPFHDMISHVASLQQQALRKTPSLSLHTYLITDGCVPQGPMGALTGQVALIDVEQAPVRRGRGRDIAHALNAHYVPLFA